MPWGRWIEFTHRALRADSDSEAARIANASQSPGLIEMRIIHLTIGGYGLSTKDRYTNVRIFITLPNTRGGEDASYETCIGFHKGGVWSVGAG